MPKLFLEENFGLVSLLRRSLNYIWHMKTLISDLPQTFGMNLDILD